MDHMQARSRFNCKFFEGCNSMINTVHPCFVYLVREPKQLLGWVCIGFITRAMNAIYRTIFKGIRKYGELGFALTFDRYGFNHVFLLIGSVVCSFFGFRLHGAGRGFNL